VQRHHRHHTGTVLGQLVGVGDQRHPLQELRQHAGVGDVLVGGIELTQRLGIGQVGAEFVCDAYQFVEVVQPRQILWVT
jgi:hypothetical protein